MFDWPLERWVWVWIIFVVAMILLASLTSASQVPPIPPDRQPLPNIIAPEPNRG